MRHWACKNAYIRERKYAEFYSNAVYDFVLDSRLQQNKIKYTQFRLEVDILFFSFEYRRVHWQKQCSLVLWLRFHRSALLAVQFIFIVASWSHLQHNLTQPLEPWLFEQELNGFYTVWSGWVGKRFRINVFLNLTFFSNILFSYHHSKDTADKKQLR